LYILTTVTLHSYCLKLLEKDSTLECGLNVMSEAWMKSIFLAVRMQIKYELRDGTINVEGDDEAKTHLK
jgi:hypothetical protein